MRVSVRTRDSVSACVQELAKRQAHNDECIFGFHKKELRWFENNDARMHARMNPAVFHTYVSNAFKLSSKQIHNTNVCKNSGKGIDTKERNDA